MPFAWRRRERFQKFWMPLIRESSDMTWAITGRRKSRADKKTASVNMATSDRLPLSGFVGLGPAYWLPRTTDVARGPTHRPTGRERSLLVGGKTDLSHAEWEDGILEAIKAKRSFALGTPAYAAVGEFPQGDVVFTAAMLARAAGYEVEAFTMRSTNELRHVDGWGWLVIPIFVLFGIAAMGAGISGTLAAMVASGMVEGITDSPIRDWHAFFHGMLLACGICAFFTATLGALIFVSLPKQKHPIFRTPHFAERWSSHEYLCLLPAGAPLDPDEAADFLHRAGASEVWEIRR